MALQKISKHVVQDNTITGDQIANDQIGTVENFTSTGIDDNATSTAITIDSSENVGIGNSIPSSFNSNANNLVVGSGSGEAGITIYSGSANKGNIYFADSTAAPGVYTGFIDYQHSTDSLRMGSNGGLERMRIDSSGNLLVGKTTTSGGTVGTVVGDGYVDITRSAARPLMVNRLSNDGQLIRFEQDNVQEGQIVVSGSTVTYAGFTGSHWSRFTDNSKPTILKGTVLESLDKMCDWYNLHFDVTTITQDENGNDVTNNENHVIPYVLQDGQSVGDVITYNYEGTDYQATIVKENDVKHMMSKISDTVDAKNVYGVFHSWDDNDEEEGYNDFSVASVGSFVVRIKANETIAKGDLLQSNGDGTAKVQTDDVIRASTFAKVLSTTVIETYDDGSFLVPCSLMC